MTFVERDRQPVPVTPGRLGRGCLALVLLLIGSCTVHDLGSRYASWAGLEKAEVLAAAGDYARNQVAGQKVCLYSVACDKGRARLVLVKDLKAWNVEALRQIAWDRRFGNACPGYTANLGLAVVEGGPPGYTEDRQAVWSFYNDRFVTTNPSNGAPLAFSEQPVEPCTAAFAIAG